MVVCEQIKQGMWSFGCVVCIFLGASCLMGTKGRVGDVFLVFGILGLVKFLKG